MPCFHVDYASSVLFIGSKIVYDDSEVLMLRNITKIILMQPSLADKRTLIYTEITQAGFSSTKFQAYLHQIDPVAGSDLRNWTLHNLQLGIGKFKAEAILKKSLVQSKKSNGELMMDQPISFNPKNQTYFRSLACGKISPSQLFNRKCDIWIKDWIKKEGNIFSKAYYVFVIKMTSKQSQEATTVERRYSDFEWLRATLTVLYPAMPIPQLPGKGKIKRDYTKHVQKRMVLLQKFLIKIYANPQICANPILQNFLTLENYKQFQKYKNTYKSIKQVPLPQIKNISGELTLLLNDDTRLFINETQKYLIASQPQIKSMYKGIKSIAQQLQTCSELLMNISSQSQRVGVNHRQVYKNFGLDEKQENLFSIFQYTSASYAKLMADEAKVLRKEIHSLLKYESLYMLGLIQTISNVKELEKTYFQNKQALFSRKQKLYEEGNMNKWQPQQKILTKPQTIKEAFPLMLYNDTKILMQERERYAYYNYEMYKELMRFFNQNECCLQNQMQNISQVEKQFAIRKYKIWQQYIQKCKRLTLLAS